MQHVRRREKRVSSSFGDCEKDISDFEGNPTDSDPGYEVKHRKQKHCTAQLPQMPFREHKSSFIQSISSLRHYLRIEKFCSVELGPTSDGVGGRGAEKVD